MRVRFILLIALAGAFAVSFAEGLETATLFGGMVRSGDSVAAGGENFTFRAIGATVSRGPPVIVTAVGGQQYFLDEDECEQLGGPLERFAICYDGSSYGTEHRDVQRRYDLAVRVEQLVARVTAEQRFERAELRVGEQTTVTTTLTNIGDEKATDVSSRDVLHASLGVWIETPGCWREGSKVIWKGALLPGQSAVCRYRIEGHEALKQSVKTELQYNNSVEVVKAVSAKTSLRVTAFPIVMNFRSPSPVDLGERANITLLINNTGKQQASLAPLTITIPTGLRIVRLSHSFTRTDGAIHRTVSIGPQSEEQVVIEVAAEQFGNHTLAGQARAVIGDEVAPLERNALVQVEGARPVARFLLYGGRGQQRLRLDVVNPGARHTYQRVEVTVKSGLPIGETGESFAELAPGAAHRLFDVPVPQREEPLPIETIVRSVGPTGQVMTDRFAYMVPATFAAKPEVLPAEKPETEISNASVAVAERLPVVEVPVVQQPRRGTAFFILIALLAAILALLLVLRWLRSREL